MKICKVVTSTDGEEKTWKLYTLIQFNSWLAFWRLVWEDSNYEKIVEMKDHLLLPTRVFTSEKDG